MTYWEDEPEQVPVDYTGDFGENSFANIFGRPPQPCKPFARPSDANLKDPLRTVKVAVKSILVANLAMSASQVAQEYRKMYGTPLQVVKYGYKDADHMLSNFSDVCSSYRDGSGNVTYMAITDERHEDLQHLIRRQSSPPEATARRTGRLPCSNRVPHGSTSKSMDTPPPSDVRSRAPWLKDRVASTKAIGQFPCAPKANRIIFNDDGPKCKARCRVIANMVREIGEKSPDGTEIRCHIETLKNHYWEHTGLSIWGKIMSIPEYADAWRTPELHEFWRIMRVARNSDDEEDRYYIIVPTHPEDNCYKWLTNEERLAKKQSSENVEDEIEFDNNLFPTTPLDLERNLDSRCTSFDRSRNYQADVHPNSIMPTGHREFHDFRPAFTSSVNSTYDGAITNFFGSTAINQPPPDISNITAESSFEATSAKPKIFYGQTQDYDSMQNTNEESNLDYPFRKDNTFEGTFDNSRCNEEQPPGYQFSTEENVFDDTFKMHPTNEENGETYEKRGRKSFEEKKQQSFMDERRPARNLAASGIRLINRHLNSHARDCRRRDPLKPCNTLPVDREDLRARQLSDMPPESFSKSSGPVEVVSTTSVTSSGTVTSSSTIPSISVSSSMLTTLVPQTSSSLSSTSIRPSGIIDNSTPASVASQTSSSLSSIVIRPFGIIDPYAALSNHSIATPENRTIRFANEDDIYTISDIPSEMSVIGNGYSSTSNENMQTFKSTTPVDAREENAVNQPIAEQNSFHQNDVNTSQSTEDKLKQLSPVEKMTELMDMLVKKVTQTMPSPDGRMSTLHCMLGFSHMLQTTAKLKLGRMIDNLEYALDIEEDRNDLESDA